LGVLFLCFVGKSFFTAFIYQSGRRREYENIKQKRQLVCNFCILSSKNTPAQSNSGSPAFLLSMFCFLIRFKSSLVIPAAFIFALPAYMSLIWLTALFMFFDPCLTIFTHKTISGIMIARIIMIIKFTLLYTFSIVSLIACSHSALLLHYTEKLAIGKVFCYVFTSMPVSIEPYQ